MGYSTDFSGYFELSPPATKQQIRYIKKFCYTRRMMRSPKILYKKYRGKHGLVGLDPKDKTVNVYGVHGEFFVGGKGMCGQDHDESVLNYNDADPQPDVWCHFEISDDGLRLEWDGGEKTIFGAEWHQYMLDKFFIPWGITLNGAVHYQGDHLEDHGLIEIVNNKLTVTLLPVDPELEAEDMKRMEEEM